MARDRIRQRPEDRRRRTGSPPASPDPIGRLDDVLATLEEMLDGRGVPPAPRRGRGGEGPPASAPARDAGSRDTLPVLQDVVAPTVNGPAEGEEGEPKATVPAAEGDPGERPRHEPLPLGFDIVEDEPLPRIGNLDLEPPESEPPKLELPQLEPVELELGQLEPPTLEPVALEPPTLEPVDFRPTEPKAVDPDPDGDRYGDSPPPSLAPEVYRHLIDRLANEIDVIVQTGTEEAMKRAAVDIAAKVREHVAIILPEVIEELVRMSDRPPD